MRQDALMPYTAASISPHRWPGFGSSNASSLTAGISPEPLSASLARPSFSLRRERRDGVLLNMSEYPRLRAFADPDLLPRSEEHTSELQSLMRITYAVFC